MTQLQIAMAPGEMPGERSSTLEQVYVRDRSFQPQRRIALQPLETAQASVLETYDRYKPEWDTAFSDVPNKEKRKWAFLDAVVSETSQYVPRIPVALREKFQQLRLGWQNAVAESRRREAILREVIRPLIPGVRQQIRQFQAELAMRRLNPDRVADPHPQNVRVVGSVSQNYGNPGPHGMTSPTDLTLSSKAWVRALAETRTLDEAITAFEHWAIVPAEADPKIPDTGLNIVTPVSTRRANPTAWRKEDNTNPYVRRFALLIDDGESNMMSQTHGIAPLFARQSVEDYRRNSQHPGYRVDAVVTVRPSKPGDANEVPIHDQLKHAYSQMQAFVKQQRTLARQQGLDPGKLRFEAYTSWQVHGIAELSPELKAQEAATGRPCKERFEEGSMDFTALFMPGDPESRENIHKAEIKKLERTYLKDFNYVVTQSGSCCSGGLTA